MKALTYAAGIVAGLALLPAARAADQVAPLGEYTPEQRGFWAFVKPVSPPVPEFSDAAGRAFVKNPIDAFVLARLRAAGLEPNGRADRATLCRRVYFDLVGLPPTPNEVAAFVADRASDAYEKLVERLLASPHHGERWGQHWLDVVRFAETDGFEYDTYRANAWRYRDYVVRAFNADKPYDRFLSEQIAGDELGPDNDEMLVAAGFNRLAPLRRNAGNQEVARSRNEVLTEMTNVVGAAFLGVTIGCARCHDHRFDPIKQTDYYRLQAYFSATLSKDVVRYTPEQRAAWQVKAGPITKEIKRTRAALDKASDDKKPELERILVDLEDQLPPPLPALFSVVEDLERRLPIRVLKRGEFDWPLGRVGMRPLGVLLPDRAPELSEDEKQPRSALARWMTDADNPLTARVMVNRVWMQHFGRGIVATPNDFGKNGARPSHPDLLDWLAREFVGRGFSLKAMHRLMLLSSTYQQASVPGAGPAQLAATSMDPDNILLWRANRRRLSAEELRDAILSVAGSLASKMGGPGVMVPIEKELVNALYKPSQWEVTSDRAEHARRSIYLIAKRNLRLPFMQVFDAPDMQVSCASRDQSTHAPQALELLNGDLANTQAELLAVRLRKQAGADPRRQVTLGYRLTTGRSPTVKELALAVEFLRAGSLREFALATFNLNAFVYVN